MDIKRFLEFRRVRRLARQTVGGIDSVIGSFRLEKQFPLLLEYRKHNSALKLRLKPYYEDYISTVSTPRIAISLELATLMLLLCNILNPRTILDLGSGFSSFVFRSYLQDAPVKPLIWSIDDDPDWLAKTRAFLSKYGLCTDNLDTWANFTKAGHGLFDLILHDLGSTQEIRLTTLTEVIPYKNPQGVLILDDMHKVPYGPTTRRILKNLNLKYYNLKSYTRDRYGRYSFLVMNGRQG
ncbi:MAG: hypothetical protein JRI57_10310 [Deltaproteobacteria bacterium]|nr:hypothetical protein [Deltaproteobacteria bacterium]MBW1953549.1 hypothetical protein [Deltaproteobacteria bacterium]MBW1987727.1 hypothetical protein [Deltaproteobacteria bacterium]MBW2134464.1 hypothetical protein [Deltaproteobacteria bacterium]